jgi:hypothetical protein
VAQTESDLRYLETHFELKIGPNSIHRGDYIQDGITTLSQQKPFWRRESYQDFLSDKLLAVEIRHQSKSHPDVRPEAAMSKDGFCGSVDRSKSSFDELRMIPR